MRVLGVVAEYNPFHNGHKYHIEQAKKIINPDITIVVMSGSFVQRGEPAIFNKWQRAKAALENGVDIVIELPVTFSMASAERFAYGAIFLLNKLGITHLAFGSENTLEVLQETLNSIDSMDKSILKKELSSGKSFATARDKATNNMTSQPNSILGIEYLKAIREINKNITPVAIKRHLVEHDSIVINDAFASASAIRDMLIQNKEVSHLVPYTYSNSVADKEAFTKAIKYAVISKGPEYIKDICEVREGLENKIYKEAFKDGTLDEYILSIKSKRYTYASISRMLFNILLDIRKDRIKDTPEYIRILGLNKEKSSYLKNITDFPVITKCASISKELKELTELDFKATDIYNLYSGNTDTDLTTSPVIK